MEGYLILAVATASVVTVLFGILWYAKPCFGRIWTKHCGLSKKELEKTTERGLTRIYIVCAVLALLKASAIEYLILATNTTTFLGGYKIALVVWLGFIVPSMLGATLWQQRSLKIFAIDMGYHIISVLLIATVLIGWP